MTEVWQNFTVGHSGPWGWSHSNQSEALCQDCGPEVLQLPPAQNEPDLLCDECALHVCKLTQSNGWDVMVSHDSGKMEDAFTVGLVEGVGLHWEDQAWCTLPIAASDQVQSDPQNQEGTGLQGHVCQLVLQKLLGQVVMSDQRAGLCKGPLQPQSLAGT